MSIHDLVTAQLAAELAKAAVPEIHRHTHRRQCEATQGLGCSTRCHTLAPSRYDHNDWND